VFAPRRGPLFTPAPCGELRCTTTAFDGLPTTELLLEQLPNGEHGWRRPERRYVLSTRYYVTDKGRRGLAMAALFDPSPTVAEAVR